ncbi:MAG: hypothetical protein II755_02820, partial [Prevotella sp.]|nr:hypothetical protein [Prevotella sp.]
QWQHEHEKEKASVNPCDIHAAKLVFISNMAKSCREKSCLMASHALVATCRMMARQHTMECGCKGGKRPV